MEYRQLSITRVLSCLPIFVTMCLILGVFSADMSSTIGFFIFRSEYFVLFLNLTMMSLVSRLFLILSSRERRSGCSQVCNSLLQRACAFCQSTTDVGGGTTHTTSRANGHCLMLALRLLACLLACLSRACQDNIWWCLPSWVRSQLANANHYPRPSTQKSTGKSIMITSLSRILFFLPRADLYRDLRISPVIPLHLHDVVLQRHIQVHNH